MADEFVVAYDELHDIMSYISRKTNLFPIFKESQPVEILDMVHDTSKLENIIPVRYYELLDIPEYFDDGEIGRNPSILYHGNYFDSTKLDVRCRGGMRDYITRASTSICSIDLLNFGLGILRPTRANMDTLAAVLGEPDGKISLKGTKIYGNFIAKTKYNPGGVFSVEDWESTNIIYGDAYGEIQQLNDRRDDKIFLEHLYKVLNLRSNMSQSLESFREIYTSHLESQSFWNQPPSSIEDLLKRVDYILEHSTLDKNPREEVKLPIRKFNPLATEGTAKVIKLF